MQSDLDWQKQLEMYFSMKMITIFQLREYPCSITHDIFFDIQQIFLEQKLICHEYF